MKITGILSVRNGTGLGYPFPLVVRNLANLCDDVIVGLDNHPDFAADWATVHKLGLINVKTHNAPWDMTNRNGGTEIALQMDKLVEVAKGQGSDWVVVMQADELLHDNDFPMLRAFMERHVNSAVNGFSLERIYFWKDLQTIRTDWNARLVRIFKPGTYSFLAEGTSKDGMFSGAIVPGEELSLSYKIYHYSRVDSPDAISRRVRNLDTFFHPEEALIPVKELPAYDFTPREYDNFSASGLPETTEGSFSRYTATHPQGVEEWYHRDE